MKLSPHFTLAELTVSAAAERMGISNSPTNAILARLKLVAWMLEHVRVILGGAPLIITSGYRSPPVNRVVGGSATSDHLTGWCADCRPPRGLTVFECVEKIRASGLAYDQLINEQEKGIFHISFSPELRGQTLTQKGASFVSGNVRDGQ